MSLLEGFYLEDPEDDRLGEDAAKLRSMTTRQKKAALRRVARASELRAEWPDQLGEGESLHVISAGDVDATNFLQILVERHGPFDHLYASTWTLSRQDVELLGELLGSGQLGGMDFFAGEYFAARETAVYATLLDMAKRHGCRVRLFKNHAKILAVRNEATEFQAVVESSANFTTNPRTEQTAVHVSAELYGFYRDHFEHLLAQETLHGEKAAQANAQKALARRAD